MYVCTYVAMHIILELLYCIEIPDGNNISDSSTSTWLIIGIIAGVILLIAIITFLLCLVLLKIRRSKKYIL